MNISNINNIVLIPKGKKIPIEERQSGCLYLEEKSQVSIRSKQNLPTSIRVGANLGLKRV